MPDRKSVVDPDELPVIEPDEDPEYEPEDIPAAPTTLTSTPASVNGSGDREYEYRTEVLSLQQVADGTTLSELLNRAATDGWHLAEVIHAGESSVVLLRKMKKNERARRTVGFAAPPSRP
ncbi:MAG: hypothetical protein M3Z13_03870 [Candidatus Dormibacteraeota bacterium]|nr:hypothetical protein [Candidatus Dormibacteraeota bacterium]